jgi:hypothetical protein
MMTDGQVRRSIDLRKAQLSRGLCPDVFARFRKGA